MRRTHTLLLVFHRWEFGESQTVTAMLPAYLSGNPYRCNRLFLSKPNRYFNHCLGISEIDPI
jgi:hypothetical protein